MEIETSLGVGYLKGDTQYEIGGLVIDATGAGEVHFPLSKLEFPLNAWMVKGQAELKGTSGWTLTLQGQTNLTDDTGKMKDYDWGVFDPVDPTRLDIYSESDTEMEALILDASLRYHFFSAPYQGHGAQATMINYFAGAGYKYQRFEFDVSNVDQGYPSIPSEPHDIIPGLVLTYEVQYDIPYLELGLDGGKPQAYSFSLAVRYSPVVNVQDEDNHLLRDKRKVADHGWNGTALGVTATCRYYVTPRWYLGLDVEGFRLESDGRADAYFGGVWDHSIDQKVKTSQVSGFLSAGVNF